MTRTITQAVSRTYQLTHIQGWTKIGLVAIMLAFCPAFLPAASANCGNAGIAPRLHAIPSLPAALSAASAGTNQTASVSNPKAPGSIVGLWNINFLSGGAIVDVAFDAWHSDGTEVLNDYTDPIEGNVCLGVYKQTGPRAYKLTHPSWYFDMNGVLQGTVIIHESVLLSPDGNNFAGSVIEDVYDVSGNLLYELTGQVSATRMTVD